MKGVSFINQVKSTDKCLTPVYYAIDDVFYLYNNLTDFKWANWQEPIFNFTGLLAANFSEALVQCYYFSNETYYYAVIRYAYFDSNLATFLYGFLFGMLGNTLVIKNVFDSIIADIKNQNYYDVAT